MRRSFVLAGACVGVLGCGRDRDEAVPPPPPAPAGPLTARTGPVELMASDGPVLAPALAGDNLYARGTNVAWRIDGDAERGYALVYDANASGDLGDDAPHSLARIGAAWEVTLAIALPDPLSGELVDAPVRLRLRDGKIHVQRAQVRRGSLPLPGGPMQFALIGDDGTFGQDYQYLAFDLDRDGRLDLDTLDGPELFHGFEKSIVLDNRGYAMSAALDGAALTLRPLAALPPPRPALVPGTPAPDIAITSLDGRRTTLSSLRGKVVLLDFWATSCKPCIEAMPALAALHARYAPRGFEVLSIAAEADDVRAKVGDHPAGIVAIDEAAQATYRVDRFPMYFLVGRDGTIACSRCRLDKVTEQLAQQLSAP